MNDWRLDLLSFCASTDSSSSFNSLPSMSTSDKIVSLQITRHPWEQQHKQIVPGVLWIRMICPLTLLYFFYRTKKQKAGKLRVPLGSSWWVDSCSWRRQINHRGNVLHWDVDNFWRDSRSRGLCSLTKGNSEPTNDEHIWRRTRRGDGPNSLLGLTSRSFPFVFSVFDLLGLTQHQHSHITRILNGHLKLRKSALQV